MRLLLKLFGKEISLWGLKSGRFHFTIDKNILDNNATVFHSYNNKRSPASKHVDLKCYVVCEELWMSMP